MKLDSLSTLSLNDISVFVSDAEKDDGGEQDTKGGEDEGGTRETLCQFRKRSRKRRSFIETDFTSRVSYPEPEQKQELGLSRFHNNILEDINDMQMLSSDPEPSEQTKNPSPTVSLLTHSEGEPAQLESKPILSKSPEQPRDGQHPTGNRRPVMEMEPDAMESKSVSDVLKAASPTITVVRCRVDPDGKECSDRKGDGKEEAESREKSDEESEEEETTGLARNGSFATRKLLPKISEEKEKDGLDEAEGGFLCGTTDPLPGNERQPEANNLATFLKDVNAKSSNGLPGAHFIAPEPNSNTEILTIESLLSYSPPPPPPSSPLPPTPQRNECEVKEPELRGSKGIPNKISLSEPKDEPPCQQNHSGQLHLHFDVAKRENEEEAVSVVSDEITDSINSDNVFEDDESSVSLNSASSDKYDWSLAARRSISASFAALGKGESQVKHHPPGPDAHKRLHSLNNDYTFAIRSITEKLGAATSATSPTFNSGAEVKIEIPHESNLSLVHTAASSNSAVVETCNSLSPIFTNATADGIHNLSKCPPPSPTHFLFQTCSPSIMGRLSASTLRGKIQKLPLYLSRSQESLHVAGEGKMAEGPGEDQAKDNVEITITDVNDVTQAVGFETDTTAESDDSDTTVTGSEVDGEFYIEAEPAKSCYPSLEEVNELSSSAPPVPTEPRAQHQERLLDTGLSTGSLPGPITQPPSSIMNSLPDSPGPKTDTPGPVKQLSPSTPTGIVVTTQNLNGPGLPFVNQSQTVRRTSRDRPLVGLCSPTEPHSDSPGDPKSPGCRVFTVCEDSPQTQVPAELQLLPALKPELSCGSVLASGCETVAEGLQAPLDACGCPPVYTNCFSGGDSFDEELTVYEFSCRSQGSGVTQASGAAPLVTSPPVPSFLSVSSSHSPLFARPNLFSSSTSELSPLLSPLSDASQCFPSPTHKDVVSRLGQQRYPEPPAGFQVLRVDVDQLLSVLEGCGGGSGGHGGRHPRDTCPAHFTENKRVLQTEAKRLTSNCQKVVGTGQSPEEMLRSLAESFRTLVGLAVVCLWFSGCDRCDRRNAEAVAGLADVARSFRDFCLAAERVSSKRSCQDLSTKLLAKQCTALTASVFCLTQIFRTLTAL